MRKENVVVSLLVVVILAGGLMLGCGQQETTTVTATTTTTTSTTNTTISANHINAAKAGAVIASGGGFVGNTATAIGGVAGAALSLSIFSVTAQSGPPNTFFTTNIYTGSASLDGWVLATSEAPGGMTPYIRMYDRGGSLIAGSTLDDKKIAQLDVSLQDLMTQTATEGAIHVAIESFASSFISSPDPFNDGNLFGQITTYGDYIGWAFLLPQMSPTAEVFLTTPEAEINDLIGSMECKMPFDGSFLSGEVIVSISVATDGSPEDGIASGTATLIVSPEVDPVTVEATISLTFNSSNLTSVTFSGVTTPEGNVVFVTMNPNTNTGTGTLSDEAGTLLGTIEVTSSGGTLYIIDNGSMDFTF